MPVLRRLISFNIVSKKYIINIIHLFLISGCPHLAGVRRVGFHCITFLHAVFLFVAGDSAPIAVNIQLVIVAWRTSDVAGVEMTMIHVLEGTLYL